MAAKKRTKHIQTLHKPVPHFVVYIVLGLLFLVAVQLVKVATGNAGY
ncbi:MAG: hypothetical protein UV61_C0002G0274 [Candidatus Gottesmanbacteria bacterium GW2011_GWB1_43_11]|uniref:Uncharacterized protein n=1 Tax=Candidatus Gottesmanbacteria bacterium GW2011_GWB1_43_11 TaxID=1618446 RepID=A0A0G1FKX3_9BACT|nr:MAG: hypothetical protein UV04_C0001G0162 [Candidatus Gottesmanbacteria bacterium GW2011_GWA2_42_16]KKS55991.1 MAG: hypothetical protein UV17_C0004G0013 [Candidatus Gottesmanbacteria bacterium GW2011_GWA1_42_26]KKS82359.1 MAG: hypothetical protein UV55_C0003G0078 [Candidatus Gottesmanbacteria bacterium GW2011_GWC1_43_10]KKS87553.1 MAG: hypothetical protein UV61_C0002G0274 [Candidatus Gottesmanbacteria bacterium GW2011_GWB1_43_11]